jgi:hypothetical protein
VLVGWTGRWCPVSELGESRSTALLEGQTTLTRVALALALGLTAPAACQDDLDLDEKSYRCATNDHCASGYVCDLKYCRCSPESVTEEPPHVEPVPGTDCEVNRHYNSWTDYGPLEPKGAGP